MTQGHDEGEEVREYDPLGRVTNHRIIRFGQGRVAELVRHSIKIGKQCFCAECEATFTAAKALPDYEVVR